MIIKKKRRGIQKSIFMSVYETTLTITSRDIIESYSESYRSVYLRKPSMRYLGNGWYLVDDEIVHQAIIIQETGRLQQIMRQQETRKTVNVEVKQQKKGLVERLISRLRAI
jgi:hypothetical protein